MMDTARSRSARRTNRIRGWIAPICWFALAWGALFAGRGVAGQESGAGDPVAADYTRIDSLLADARPAEALRLLEPRLVRDPGEVEALWRAARAEAIGGLIEPRLQDARAYYRRGIEYADRALAVEPDHREARVWSMVNKGRLALWTGARETADLAQEVWDLAHGLLEEDENSAMAHHGLGMIHYEVRKMGWAKRMLARVFLGGDPLAKTRWDLATHHLRRAVVLDPDSKFFRLYYVRAMAHQGWTEESLDEARMGLARPNRHPLDARFDDLLRKHVRSTESEG